MDAFRHLCGNGNMRGNWKYFKWNLFLEKFCFTAKLSTKYRIPRIPIVSPTNNLRVEALLLSVNLCWHITHPKSMAYTRDHSWWCTFYRYGKFIRMCYPPLQYQSNLTALKTLWALPIPLSLPPNPWQPLIFLPSPVNSNCFAVSRMSYSWNHTACSFSDCFLSLSHTLVRFLHVFQGLITHFFIILNNIPLSGCITVHPFICWRASCWLSSLGNYK